jgi:integrase
VPRRGRGEGSIFHRKDGRWEARVDLGWQDGRRRRKALYGATRQEVRGKLVEALRAREQGLLSTGSSQTVGQFLARWFDGSTVSLRPKTVRTYEYLVRVHLIPGLGRYRLDRLTPEDVQTFLDRKLQVDGLSGQTAAHLRAVLRTALNRAVRWGFVARNVAALSDPPRVRRYDYKVLSPEEAQRLLAATTDDRLHALYSVATALGLRQGEALGLRWEELDLERRELRVRFALQRVKGQLVLVEPKTKTSRRTIRLPVAVVEALRAHRARQLEDRLVAGSAWQECGLVFTTRKGTPLEGTEVTKHFQRRLIAAGLPRMRFHELRHSAASLMLAQGVPLRSVMEVLGHSTIALTANTYGHLFPNLLDDAADAMDRALKPAQPEESGRQFGRQPGSNGRQDAG